MEKAKGNHRGTEARRKEQESRGAAEIAEKGKENGNPRGTVLPMGTGCAFIGL